MNAKKIYYILGSTLLVFLLLIGVWFFFFRAAPSTTPATTNGFGTGGNVSVTGSTNAEQGNTPQPNTANSSQRVFKIANGPVSGATFVQTFSPTTTLARYVMQDSGHVLDVAIGVPGAAPRPASNTTIPGIATTVFEAGGNGALLQYIERGAVKTLHVTLPSATSTQAGAAVSLARIQFLPDNILSFAISPDGKNVAYLLGTKMGVDGYIANSDGTNTKKIFSLPLSQILLSWPSPNTLLAQTKSAAGVSGMAFSIAVKTGVASSLLYSPGLSLTANANFSKIIYQSVSDSAGVHRSYSHDVATGQDLPLLLNPSPEKCIWSGVNNTVLYCAAPLEYVAGDYTTAWHQGLITAADSIFKFNTLSGASSLIETLGSGNSAPQEPIDQMAISPDGKYLLFTTRGDRSLWGVRL